MPVAGDVIAEQHDDVGVERIGLRSTNRLDALKRHPGIAGVKVGDGGDLELETGGPSRRPDMVARDAKAQRGLDTKSIGDG